MHRCLAVVSDVAESSWNGHVVVVGRHLLAADGDDSENATTSVRPTTHISPTLWFVELVVGNRVIFCLCILILLAYLGAVVARVILHAYWGPVRIYVW